MIKVVIITSLLWATSCLAISQPEAPVREEIKGRRVIIDESIKVTPRSKEDLTPSNLEFKRMVKEQSGRADRMQQDFKEEVRKGQPVPVAPTAPPIRNLADAKQAGLDPLNEVQPKKTEVVDQIKTENHDEFLLYALASSVFLLIIIAYYFVSRRK